MQKCNCCSQPVKYIATSHNVAVTCDAEEIVFYTEFGRRMIGYKIHECKGKQDGYRENTDRQNPGSFTNS